MNDDLKPLLRAWRVEPTLDPEFKNAVWRRIHAATPAGERAPATIVAFPRLMKLAAGLAILISIGAGVGAGVQAGRRDASDRMAAQYARTIDPILMSGTGHHGQP